MWRIKHIMACRLIARTFRICLQKPLWWSGRKIIDGEAKRTSQGGIPIYNPTIAKVRVHYDIFTDSYDRQKNLQSLTARSLEALSAMRTTADELILDIWNQVEKKFEDVSPNEKRLDLCRDYGLIYYYRTGEKRKEEANE